MTNASPRKNIARPRFLVLDALPCGENEFGPGNSTSSASAKPSLFATPSIGLFQPRVRL